MPGTPASKKTRRALRELFGKAYERELSQALSELESKFKAWRNGSIDCFKLNKEIHKYHDGVARDLWELYGGDPEVLVPVLVAKGILKESELPDYLLHDLRSKIDGIRHILKGMEEDQRRSEGAT